MTRDYLIPRPFGNNRLVPTVADEFRTPMMSLFDSLMTDMFKEFEPFRNLVPDVRARAYPKVDVRRVKDDLVFEAAVPFVKKEDLDIRIKDGVLVLAGNVQKDETVEEGSFVKRELVRSSFARSFPLNEEMHATWEKEGGVVEADLNEGILTVKLVNFFEEERPVPGRKIEIT